MFADNTLTPKEAVRLCALGTIARAPQRYAELAGSVRRFISGVAGPQLDLMGTSIELLRYEGLVEAVEGSGADDNVLLAITAAGRRDLHGLLTARIRPGSDLSKLIVALKMRFLHLLEPAEQRAQADLLAEGVEAELARLADLRDAYAAEDRGEGALVEWLDHDIALLQRRLDWLDVFSAGL